MLNQLSDPGAPTLLFLKKDFMYLFERERESMSREEGQREREKETFH